MIVAIHPITFEPCITYVDSSTTRIISGIQSGESYYGIGGYAYCTDKIQKYRITEYFKGLYIERYLIGPKGYLFNNKWRSDRLLCQISLRVIDPKLSIQEFPVTSLIDRLGIERCLGLYNDLHVNTKFISTIFYKCMKEEARHDTYLSSAIEDAETCTSIDVQLGHKLAPHLNYGREFMPACQPTDMVFMMLDDYQNVNKGYLQSNQILHSLEDYFVPNGLLTFPNRFSSILLNNPGVSQDEVYAHTASSGKSGVCTEEVNFMDLAKFRFKIQPTGHYDENIMDLIDICDNMVFSDLYFEYISLKCTEVKSTIRYAGVKLPNGYMWDIIRAITQIIGDKMFPNIQKFKFYKTYDHEIYIELDGVIYVIDIVLGNMVSLALHR